jgi:hypothetical protein
VLVIRRKSGLSRSPAPVVGNHETKEKKQAFISAEKHIHLTVQEPYLSNLLVF